MSIPYLIGIAGSKGSGKDTMADYLCDRYQYQKRAFADPIKDLCRSLFHLSMDQLTDPVMKETVDPRWQKSPRQILQIVGTDLFRHHYHEDFWLQHFEQWYLSLQHHPSREDLGSPPQIRVVCSDIRFQNELDLIHRLGGQVVRIHRSSYVFPPDSHESEREVHCLQHVDMEMDNKGMHVEEFYQVIDRYMLSFFSS